MPTAYRLTSSIAYELNSFIICVICGPEASDKVPDASIEDEHEHERENQGASSLTPETRHLKPLNPEPGTLEPGNPI